MKSIEAPVLSVTVGKEGMFSGHDHFAIQGAVDYVSRLGGGVVRMLPGRYSLRNAIFLGSGVTLEGCGDDTVLSRSLFGDKSPLISDLDWYGWKVEIGGAAESWRVGDGLMIESLAIDGGTEPQFTRHTVIAVGDGFLGLDSQPRVNHWMDKEAVAIPAYSLIEARYARGVRMQNFSLEGGGVGVPHLDGNHGGAIFLQDCEDISISRVSVRDFHGDAISWQIVHDVVVEDCVIERAHACGLHAGSGSQRPIMRRNVISDCLDGIFWCWGVRDGLAEDNQISSCRRDGISIGHRDTDNMIRGNHIAKCAEAGIHFREELSPGHTAHRVRIENNEIHLAEGSDAKGVVIARGVEDADIANNVFIVPPGGEPRAIEIDPMAIRPQIDSNEIREAF